jgi:hypothetical protein
LTTSRQSFYRLSGPQLDIRDKERNFKERERGSSLSVPAFLMIAAGGTSALKGQNNIAQGNALGLVP